MDLLEVDYTDMSPTATAYHDMATSLQIAGAADLGPFTALVVGPHPTAGSIALELAP